MMSTTAASNSCVGMAFGTMVRMAVMIMMMLQLLSRRRSTSSTRLFLFLPRCLDSFFLLLNSLIGSKSPGRCSTGRFALLRLRTRGIVLSRRAGIRRCSWLLLLMMMMVVLLNGDDVAAGYAG